MSGDIFDFGFTAVTEDELASVEVSKKIAEESQTEVEILQDKLDNLYNSITPLLENLKKNPDKEYILWPNRLSKVNEFQDHIRNIYEGN
jgi:hypothetical protein